MPHHSRTALTTCCRLSLSGWAIRGGYRPDPQGKGPIGFITWDRVSHGNVPRLEIDPDGNLTLMEPPPAGCTNALLHIMAQARNLLSI